MKLYIWSTVLSLVIIIFVGGSIIHLVIQESVYVLSCKNSQDANNIINNINGIIGKCFSHEPPTPNQFFKKMIKTREWVTQGRNLIFHAVHQMCYIRGFIRYENTAFSLNYGTGASLRCCKDVKGHAVL